MQGVNAAIAKAPWRMKPCEDGENFLRVFILKAGSNLNQLRFDIVIRGSRLLLSVTPLRMDGQEQAHGEIEALLISEGIINGNEFDSFF